MLVNELHGLSLTGTLPFFLLLSFFYAVYVCTPNYKVFNPRRVVFPANAGAVLFAVNCYWRVFIVRTTRQCVVLLRTCATNIKTVIGSPHFHALQNTKSTKKAAAANWCIYVTNKILPPYSMEKSCKQPAKTTVEKTHLAKWSAYTSHLFFFFFKEKTELKEWSTWNVCFVLYSLTKRGILLPDYNGQIDIRFKNQKPHYKILWWTSGARARVFLPPAWPAGIFRPPAVHVIELQP